VDTSKEAIARRQAARSETAALSKNPSAMIAESTLDVSAATEAKILSRLSEMPVTARKTYLDGMCGKSRVSGIKAFCQMCIGYGDQQIGMRRAIRDCTDPACPLYPYRPYQEKDAPVEP